MRVQVLARWILWRLVALIAAGLALCVIVWGLDGGLARTLSAANASAPWVSVQHDAEAALRAVALGLAPLFSLTTVCAVVVGASRGLARRRRCYVRLRVVPYRTDESTAEGIVALFESLHKRLLVRGRRRVLFGQPSLALEVHRRGSAGAELWLAVSVPAGAQAEIEAALRVAYRNCALEEHRVSLGPPPVLLRLRKKASFIKRAKPLDHHEHERAPAMNALMTAIAACRGPAYVQLALTPAPAALERYARGAYKRHERRTRPRMVVPGDARRSLYDEVELKGGLSVQHQPLFFVDLRVVAEDRAQARHVASQLRAQGAENRLVERGAAARPLLVPRYARRLARGEGAALPPFHRGVFAATELAALWHLPSVDFASVPFTRASVPLAPAPPTIERPRSGAGVLRDAYGPVSIHEEARRGNIAAPGAVEQGKSSLLAASAAADMQRARCAVITLDPKGDAADAVLSAVPGERTCTLLDLAHPTCGFNPLAAAAPPDVVADYVVAALRNLFTDADIRASSDRLPPRAGETSTT